MTIKISKLIAYLLLIIILLFLILLLVINLKTDFSALEIIGIRSRPSSVEVENTPLKVIAEGASTKKIESADTWLGPGQVHNVVDVRGSGVFYTLWYSTTSEVVWLRITIDGKVIWKNNTGIFSYGWAFNKNESGIGGVTNYGDSATHLGPVYGVYFKPSPTGLPFKDSLKIEFGNDAPDKQLVYYSQGFYSINR